MVLQSREQNFNEYRGDDWVLDLTIKRDGAVEDITGWTFFLTVKSAIDDAANDSAAVATATVTSHTDAANGRTLVSIPAATTDGLSGDYFYDLQYKDDAGIIRTLLFGVVNFTKDVTRRTS